MQELTTTFVSHLDGIDTLHDADLFLVSRPKDLSSAKNYQSKKLSWKDLSTMTLSAMHNTLYQEVVDLVTPIANGVYENMESIQELSSQHMVCESAVIKIANCLAKVKADISTLSGMIDLDWSLTGDGGILNNLFKIIDLSSISELEQNTEKIDKNALYLAK